MLLWTHLAVTWTLVGLIWTIQVVHYPLMACVGRAEYGPYQAAHMKRMSWLVAPLMLLELSVAIALISGSTDVALRWTGLALVVGIWGSTALIQVPLHTKLEKGLDERVIKQLVHSNWIRTAAWSARGGIAIALVA